MKRKKRILIALWSIVALAWLAVIAVYLATPSQGIWIAAVTGAAIVSELAVWGTAAILGLTILESRKRIWKRITAPLRKSQS